MLAIIVLLLAIITLTMGFLAWEQGAKGWWLWIASSVAFFVSFSGFIQS